MKVKQVDLEIGTFQYQEDGPPDERGNPRYKKGATYYKANKEWCEFHSYQCYFIGDLGFYDLPRSATDAQRQDVKMTMSFIRYFWDELEEQWVIKMVNKAKSKRLAIFPFIYSEFQKLKNEPPK